MTMKFAKMNKPEQAVRRDLQAWLCETLLKKRGKYLTLSGVDLETHKEMLGGRGRG